MVIGLDLVSDGTVSGFDFKVRIPGLDIKSANLKTCAAELPKGFTGQCSAVGDMVYVIASGDALNSVLPAGMIPVGKIYLRTKIESASRPTGTVEVVEANMSDTTGKTVSAIAKILSE